MTRRLPIDASEENTKRPSEKPALTDLLPFAAMLSTFTARDMETLKAWVIAMGDFKRGGTYANCPPQQVYNVVRKLRRFIRDLESGRSRRVGKRYDPRKARRLLKKVVLTEHDAELARALKADPMGTLLDVLARREAASRPEKRALEPLPGESITDPGP